MVLSEWKGKSRLWLKKAIFRHLAILIVASILGDAWKSAGMPPPSARPKGEALCRKLILSGQVSQGREWKGAIGQGWVFRVIPIASTAAEKESQRRYSGWDLVLDRADGLGVAGYPDALLLATPPYGSLNAREIGTTFGLRAQDALGWEPRPFRYLTSETDLARARGLFSRVTAPGKTDVAAQSELLQIIGRGSAGQFRVVDAKLRMGVHDPEFFAQKWAANFKNVPHTVEDGTQDSPLGEIRWVRFEATFWLPKTFTAAPEIVTATSKCAQ